MEDLDEVSIEFVCFISSFGKRSYRKKINKISNNKLSRLDDVCLKTLKEPGGK